MQLFIDVEVGFSGAEIQYVNNFLERKKSGRHFACAAINVRLKV